MTFYSSMHSYLLSSVTTHMTVLTALDVLLLLLLSILPLSLLLPLPTSPHTPSPPSTLTCDSGPSTASRMVPWFLSGLLRLWERGWWLSGLQVRSDDTITAGYTHIHTMNNGSLNIRVIDHEPRRLGGANSTCVHTPWIKILSQII